MNLKSYQKLSYDKKLAMAEEMEQFVSLMKAQHFDPFKDYDWAMGCDLKAVNRDKVEIVRIPLLSPEYADKNVRPSLVMWYLGTKKGSDKTDKRFRLNRKLIEREFFDSQ